MFGLLDVKWEKAMQLNLCLFAFEIRSTKEKISKNQLESDDLSGAFALNKNGGRS